MATTLSFVRLSDKELKEFLMASKSADREKLEEVFPNVAFRKILEIIENEILRECSERWLEIQLEGESKDDTHHVPE